MTVSAALVPARPSEEAAARQGERRALGVAFGAHALHDGYTDLVWVALPIWQAEFGLSYAAVGLLRTVYSGTLASLQIPAAALAERIARVSADCNSRNSRSNWRSKNSCTRAATRADSCLMRWRTFAMHSIGRVG